MKKKKLSQKQEFEIMKLVLDKFLWLGFIVMGYGLWKMFTDAFLNGLVWIGVGAIVLILFVVLIVKEYEIVR